MTVTQPITNIQHIPTAQLTAMVTWLTSVGTGSRAALIAQIAAELVRRSAETALALASIVQRPIGYLAVREWKP